MVSLIAGLLLFPASIPSGVAEIQVEVKGLPMQVYTYKPKSYRGDKMIMVFHGVNRNADEYRDHSKNMGEKFGALIVAPKFDAERFPSRKYQFGGILKEDRTAAPPEEWTYTMVPLIAKQVRRLEGKPKMPLYIIGHSAGGQFVMRMAGFFDPGAVRMVAANPGSDLFPELDRPFGYGFGNLPANLSNESVLKAYLAKPLTIYLGTGDNKPDENFDASVEAMKQGPGRMQRGRECFRRARALASEKGWKFNWRLVEAIQIPHDHERMFDNPKCEEALFGK